MESIVTTEAQIFFSTQYVKPITKEQVQESLGAILPDSVFEAGYYVLCSKTGKVNWKRPLCFSTKEMEVYGTRNHISYVILE